ncbi:MAG: HD family hydrolase [Devosiaceae bacterium]|nr:HD family hydrolase [Devosiaceae bacterium MH13]
MLSGRRLDLADPSPFDIEIEDIAHGLARVARWNGQTVGDHPFSVAQHSVVVADLVATLQNGDGSAGLQLAALLHDGPEYVIGDMISPFKALLGDGYRAVEARIGAVIHLRYGLPAEAPTDWHEAIKTADRICAYHEATQLAGFAPAEATRFFGEPPADLSALALDPLPPRDAEALFLERHHALTAAYDDERGG